MSEATALDDLPGDLMMWVLIVSELLVFGAGLTAFMAVRLTDPAGFAAAQDHLFRAGAALNTMVLVTSGLLAALAVRWRAGAARTAARGALVLAAALGMVFLWIKGMEYAAKAAQGIGWDTHPFFTFYYLLTGFHAAHVIAGVILLLLVAVRDAPRNVEAAAMFWHMVDLVWVLLFPVVYLLGMIAMPDLSKPLLTAWAWLAGLGLAAALIAQAPGDDLPRSLAGVAILGLALVKARVILARYLGLARAPAWLAGFMWVIALWGLLVLGLYLVPALRA